MIRRGLLVAIELKAATWALVLKLAELIFFILLRSFVFLGRFVDPFRV